LLQRSGDKKQALASSVALFEDAISNLAQSSKSTPTTQSGKVWSAYHAFVMDQLHQVSMVFVFVAGTTTSEAHGVLLLSVGT